MTYGDTEQQFCELVRLLAPQIQLDQDGALRTLDERLRFRGDVGYSNPGREIVRVEQRSAKTEVFVNRYVLAGIYGPMPEPFQELAARRAASGDGATAAFLDLFNHRLNVLRFWIRARQQSGLYPVSASRSPVIGLSVGFAEGRCPSDAAGQDIRVPLRAVGLAALLRQPDRSLTVIECILRRLLTCPLEIIPFRGGWVRRRSETHSRLGLSNSRLGTNTVLGTKVWDPNLGMELHLHCADRASFESMLPGTRAHARLCQLVRWATQRRFDVIVLLRLPGLLPAARLSAQEGSQLGLNSSLGTLTATPKRTAGPLVTTVRFVIHAEDDTDEAAA